MRRLIRCLAFLFVFLVMLVQLQPITRASDSGVVGSSTSIFLPLLFGRSDYLDHTFGANGKMQILLGPNHYTSASVMALQPDGKILVAGSSTAPPDAVLVVLRFNADGSLDPTFGTGGVARPTFNWGAWPTALVIQPDRKIVLTADVALSAPYFKGVGLMRLNPDGSLDSSFAGGGKFIDTTMRLARGIVVQSDGKLVASATDGRLLLARYNGDGTPDAGFGTAGRVYATVGAYAEAAALALQSDGKFIVGGITASCTLIGCPSDMFLARLGSDGTLDTSFALNGIAVIDTIGAETIGSLLIQLDGRILASRTPLSSSGPYFDYLVMRFLLNGTLDTAFGRSGFVVSNVPDSSDVCHLGLLPDGNIVMGGTIAQGGDFMNHDFLLLRYLGNGAPDPTASVLTTDLGGDDILFALAVQPDGKTIAAGVTYRDNANWLSLVRYMPY